MSKSLILDKITWGEILPGDLILFYKDKTRSVQTRWIELVCEVHPHPSMISLKVFRTGQDLPLTTFIDPADGYVMAKQGLDHRYVFSDTDRLLSLDHVAVMRSI